MSHVRVDKWLCAARVFKSRTIAQTACTAGQVSIDGHKVKPSDRVQIGQTVEALTARGLLLLRVLALAEKRLSPASARQLYEDHSPPRPPKEERVAPRERGSGRPTKAERRALERFRGSR